MASLLTDSTAPLAASSNISTSSFRILISGLFNIDIESEICPVMTAQYKRFILVAESQASKTAWTLSWWPILHEIDRAVAISSDCRSTRGWEVRSLIVAVLPLYRAAASGILPREPLGFTLGWWRSERTAFVLRTCAILYTASELSKEGSMRGVMFFLRKSQWKFSESSLGFRITFVEFYKSEN